MSGSVDTKTVEMRFDNKDFESNVKQSMSTLEKLKSALKLDGASKGLSDIEKASKKLDFKDLDRSIDDVGHKFNALETIATGVFLKIGMAAADAGMKLVKSFTVDQIAAGWNKYEQKTTSVQTIMSNLQDTTGKFVDEASKMDYVNKQIEKLNWFSDETSYSLTDMTDNIGKFVANGQDLEESVQAMQGIATWAAISGQNSQVAARVMYNVSQAMGAGSMKIVDWKSIENANMATAEFKQTAIEIAQKKGKIKEGQVTIENFRESLSDKDTKNWFDKEVMMDTFKEYSSAVQKVQDKIEQVEKETGRQITASKALKMLKAEDEEFAKSLGYRAFAAAQEAKTLREAIDATADAVSTKWTQIFESIFGNYLQQKELWTDLANDLWDVFAEPLDNLREIFEVWNEGLDGISGRTHIIEGFKNIFNSLIHSVRDEATGEIVKFSIFDSIKNGFKEVFGLNKDADELGKSLFNLTKRFYEFTEKMKPSDATLEKIKNSFKGLFTLFKIGGKLIKSIVKPFKTLFEDNGIFKKGLNGILDLSDGFANFIQRFDQFLDENKVFDSISDGISFGFKKIGEALDWVTNSLAGVSFKDFIQNAKNSILDFFNNFDFKEGFGSVGLFVSNAINEIKQIKTEDLPEKLTPLQNFYLGIQGIFNGMRKFFSTISPAFKFIGDKINSFFNSVGEAFENRKIQKAPSRFTPIFEGLTSIFKGIGDFFVAAGPTLKKVGQWIGDSLGKLGEGLAKLTENKSATEIIESIVKGGFFLSLTNLINSIAGLNWGKKGILDTIAEDLGAVKGVLKAYQREINVSTIFELAMAIGVLSGSMWVLAQIPSEKLEPAGKALGRIALAIAGFSALKDVFKIITNLTSKMEGRDSETLFGKIRGIFTGMVSASVFANDASAKFLKASAAIAFLAVGFRIFSKSLLIFTEGVNALGENYGKGPFKDGLKALAYIAGGLAVLSLFSGLGARKPISALASVLAFIVLVKAITTLVSDITSLGQNTNMTFFKSGLYMFGMFAAVVTLFTTLNSIGTGKIKSAIGLYVSMLAVVLLVRSIIESLSKLTKDTDETKLKNAADIMRSIARTMLIWLAAFAIIEKIGKRRGAILSAGAAVLAAAGAIYIIALALEKVAKAGDSTKIGSAGKALKSMAFAVGLITGLLGIVSGLNFRFGNAAGLISGAYFGTLGVPIGAISFVAACGGVWIMANALSTLGESKFNFDNIDKFKSLATHIGLITGILGLVSGFNIGAIAGPVAFGFSGTIGVPVAALSFVAACQGVYVMAEAFSMLADKDTSSFSQSYTVINDLSQSIAWILGLLGAAAGFNLGIPFVAGINGSIGVPLAALSFAAACQGVYVMAEALSILSEADPAKLESARTNIQELTTTISDVLILLSEISGFGMLGELVGAASFDLIVLGLWGLVRVLDEFSHIDLSNLEDNCRKVADALNLFVEKAAAAVEKAAELAEKVAPAAIILGLALVVLAVGVAAMGAALIVLGLGLEAIGTGASAAGDGINDAADAFVELSGKDLSGIGQNLLIMAGALLGISIAGLAASPGLIALGFALEAVLTPITNATNAIGDLLTAIDNLTSGEGGGSGPKISVGSFVPGKIGFAVRAVEYLSDVVKKGKDDVKEAAEEYGPAIQEGADSGIQASTSGYQASGKQVDAAVANGINSSDMASSAAYQKFLEMYDQLNSGSVTGMFGQTGLGWITALIGGGGTGFMGLPLGSVGNMQMTDLLSSLKDGGKDLGPMGTILASTFGDAFKDYDFAEISKMGLDQIVSTLSNGQLDVKQAGEMLTNVFGDEWKNFDWQSMTLTDVIGILTKTFNEGGVDVQETAKQVSEAGAEAMEQEDKYGAAGGKNILGYKAAIIDGESTILDASTLIADASSSPIEALDSYTWGSDLSSNYAAGIKSQLDAVTAAAKALAEAVAGWIHFSEPDVGPLSDFHTFAPDMIKLWCKGVYDNLDQVEDSSEAMADTVYDGFSTALEYVSDLIDNGMSDELAIRPVMDLSGIQNGIQNLDSMISGANGYSISGTARLAASAAYGIGNRSSSDVPVVQPVSGSTNNYNTFNITNDDPNAVAQKVSRLLDQGAKREQAVWAR